MFGTLKTALRFTQTHPYLTAGGAVALAYGVRQTQVGAGPVGTALLLGAVGGLVNAGAHAAGAVHGPGAMLSGNPTGEYPTFDACVRSKAHTHGIRDAHRYCGGIEARMHGYR